MTKLETTLLNLAHQHLAGLFCLHELACGGTVRPEDQKSLLEINAALDALLEISHTPNSGLSEKAVQRMQEIKAKRTALGGGIHGMTDAVADWAQSEPLVRKAYLFGSRVRGTHRQDSDLDVAVEIDALPGDSCPFTTWTAEAQRLKASIAGLVPVVIDLEWYGGEEETPHVHHALQRSSVVVYDQS